MDLERIKQSFRIRSGRGTQRKKKAKPTQAPAPNTAQAQAHATQPNGDLSKQETSSKDTQEDLQLSNSQQPEEPEEEKKEQSLNSTEGAPKEFQDSSPRASDEPQNIATDASTDIEVQQSHIPQLVQQNMDDTSSDVEDFDLKPPKPRSKPLTLENLSELLFSSGHLDSILHHPPQLARFSAFLQKYMPHHHPLLAQYLETQKAIKAVAYANAIAEGLKPKDTGKGTTTETRRQAASLDSEFEAISNASFKALVGDALPTFISYNLVKTVSECLTNEITGRSTPMMRDLVEGLSEVFCLTDPNQHDNPIIYASEEFYRLTRYGPEDTLNSNCRFLQGRRTNPDSPKRLKAAIESGEEISETLLNYRRDGKPFLNLLMVAPLHDKNGKIKYHIGAQVDVTALVEGGRALEGFQRYLVRRAEEQKKEERQQARQGLDADQRRKRQVLARLKDLSETFDLEESAVVQANSRSNSLTRDEDDDGSIGSLERTQRRVYGGSDVSDADEESEAQQQNAAADWKLGQAGDGRLSGKLPGVYNSFMLVRPAPSLRIVFVSPKLRKIGNVLQTPFLAHVAAPSATLTGLAESLKSGVPVSAKIHFKPERGENRNGTILRNGTKHEDGKNGKAVWISCTPLLGEDDRVGVWMCVVVEKSKVGAVKTQPETKMQKGADQPLQSIENGDRSSRTRAEKPRKIEIPSRSENAPIKPVRIDSGTVIVKEQAENLGEAKANETDIERSAKSIRQIESVYFDAIDGQEPESMSIDAETHTEPISHAATHSGTNGDDRTLEVATDQLSTRAVETPVEDHEEPTKDAKVNGLQVSDELFSPAHQGRGDEYVNTRSSVTQATKNYEMVVENNSDAHLDKSADDDSSDQIRPRDSRSVSAVLSSASDIPPSIPSSAQLPDDNDARQEGNFEAPRQVQDRPSAPSSDKGHHDEHREDINTNDAASEESQGHIKSPGSRQSAEEPSTPKSPSQHSKSSQNEYQVDEEFLTAEAQEASRDWDTNSDSKAIQNEGQEDMRASSAASEGLDHNRKDGQYEQQDDTKAGTTTLAHTNQDHYSNPSEVQDDQGDYDASLRNVTQDREVDQDAHLEQDRDSAISMETPERTQAKSASRSPAQSPARRAHYLEDVDIEEEEHQQDVERWVEDARPPTSRQGSRMKMDYLRAGSSRWRPPRLGDAAMEDDDRSTNFDECVRSPYSVD